MISTKGIANNIHKVTLAKVSADSARSQEDGQRCAIVIEDFIHVNLESQGAILITPLNLDAIPSNAGFRSLPLVHSIPGNYPFHEGDILEIYPSGRICIVFRRGSLHNVLFLTHRCNCACLMCPQPPREDDDQYRIALCQEMVKMMDKSTPVIAITGGEPTLAGKGLLQVIESLRDELPETRVDLLTNARAFSSWEYAKALQSVQHPGLSICVPLYGDTAIDHDFATQVRGSFDETIRGMHNLARLKQRIEIRVVMMKLTAARLKGIAEYIWWNLPFAACVCFMGMEPIGQGWRNRESLWIDPFDYQDSLLVAVEFLSVRGMQVLIYNEQLCILRESLWQYSYKSISDWKNCYLKECSLCIERNKCGGLFVSGNRLHSQHIVPFIGFPSNSEVSL